MSVLFVGGLVDLLQVLEGIVRGHQLPCLRKRVVNTDWTCQRGSLLGWSERQGPVFHGCNQADGPGIPQGLGLIQTGQNLGVVLQGRGVDGVVRLVVVRVSLLHQIRDLRGFRGLYVAVVHAVGNSGHVAALFGALEAVIVLFVRGSTR